MTQDDHGREASALDIEERIASMSDREIHDAYLDTNGQPGDPWVDALTRAMQEREIDF